MTYQEVKDMIPPKRRWCRYMSCLYLQRWRGAIRIRYGYRYRSTQTIAVWYPNGRFKFKSALLYPSQRFRLNLFMPGDFQACTHRYHTFLYKSDGKDEPRTIYIPKEERRRFRTVENAAWISISPKGRVTPKLGLTLAEIRRRLKHADHVRDLPRRRGRYWRRKARGIYRNPCGHPWPQKCNWRDHWPKPTTDWRGECGCKVYTKKAVSRDTVETIMEEQNATVRTAKIQIYGVDKFFVDAKAKTTDKEANYELIRLDTGPGHRETDRWGREQTANVVLTALRMTCSTTGKVYVNTVPPQIRTVREGLNWMYDTTNYLGRVGKQT